MKRRLGLSHIFKITFFCWIQLLFVPRFTSAFCWHTLPYLAKIAWAVTARKDDAAAADQAATAKVAVSVSAGCDGGLIQTTPG